jgi:phosphate transport system substrate-binding protein
MLCKAPLAASVLLAQQGLPIAPPPAGPGGTLRLWGDPAMASVVQAWENRFQRDHPEVRFETRLMGTDTAMPGLYGGVADLALVGRESNTTENDGFLHSLQYKPLQLRLMTGSLDSPGKSEAVVLFVQKSNPLRRLTLPQVRQLLSCDAKDGPCRPPVWGDLGLGGEWRAKPVHLYLIDTESGTGTFFLHAVQGESRRLNWQPVREFSDSRHPDGTIYEAAEQIMDALANDPLGLAVSSLRYASSEVAPLALSAGSGSPYVMAMRESLIAGTYPLARRTYVLLNQPPGQPVPPLAKEFLRFVYSKEGQEIVSESGGFLPLAAEDAAAQAALLR